MWRGKRSQHSRRMRNPQFFVSCKRPMKHQLFWHSFFHVIYIRQLSFASDSSVPIAWMQQKRPLVFCGFDIWLYHHRNGECNIGAPIIPTTSVVQPSVNLQFSVEFHCMREKGNEFSFTTNDVIKQLTTTELFYSDVIMGTMASQITSLINVYSSVYYGADQRKH